MHSSNIPETTLTKIRVHILSARLMGRLAFRRLFTIIVMGIHHARGKTSEAAVTQANIINTNAMVPIVELLLSFSDVCLQPHLGQTTASACICAPQLVQNLVCV